MIPKDFFVKLVDKLVAYNRLDFDYHTQLQAMGIDISESPADAFFSDVMDLLEEIFDDRCTDYKDSYLSKWIYDIYDDSKEMWLKDDIKTSGDFYDFLISEMDKKDNGDQQQLSI